MSANPRPHPPASAAPPGALRERLLRVIAQHQRGEFQAAIDGYLAVLDEEPRQFDALRLLGAAQRAIAQHAQAVASFDRALAVRGDFAEVWSLRGESLGELGRHDEAVASFDSALASRPAFAEAWFLRADMLGKMGRNGQARESLERAIALRPDYAAAWAALGLQLHALERHAEAIGAFDRSLALAPNAAAWNNRGLSFDALGQPAKALESYDRALAANDAIAEVWCNRAKALSDLGRMDEALASLDRASELMPDLAAAVSGRATPLRLLGRLEEALAACDRALAMEADAAHCWAQRAATLAELGRFDAADASYGRALELEPGDSLVAFNRGLLYLGLGRYAQGWEGYEKRPGIHRVVERLGVPVWDGASSLQGKVLLIQCEQGLGDTLQFCRYVPLLVERGARVILRVPSTLQRLASSVREGVRVLTDGDVLPSFDLQCPLVSLPHRFGTTLETIPAEVPYLAPPAQALARWRAMLGIDATGATASRPGGVRLRIGLVCSGSIAGGPLRFRALPLALFLPVMLSLKGWDIEWHLLQTELRDDDVPALAQSGLRDHRAELHDFSETAALAACMDLIVSVDTAVAHLAGALALPVFILLRSSPDWRWLVDRSDSPWYPTARLFRQQTLGDWSGVLDQLRQALEAFVSRALGSPAEARAGGAAIVDPSLEPPTEAASSHASVGSAPRPAALDPERVPSLPSPYRSDWRDDELLGQLQKAARGAQGDPAAQFNLGLRYLALGRLDPGWEYYEWRVRVPRLFTPMPEGGAYWDGGQELDGKTLLLCHEQGLGDVIQFGRFVPYLARLGARVLLGVPPPLARLMGSLEGVDRVLSGAEPVPPFDLKCLLMSVAQRLGITLETVPARIPYLRAPAESIDAWRERLGSGSGARRPLRIGIACSGSPTHAGDALRSIGLARFAAVFDALRDQTDAGAFELHLLQNTLRAQDEAALAEMRIIDHREQLVDLAETAALVGAMDVVVTVDTSVAHLAGALGAPLFVLLPADPDWRWMLEREDSPWYPSARLLRCRSPGQWDTPLSSLQHALTGMLRAGVEAAVPCGGGVPSARVADEYPLLPVFRSNVFPPDLGSMLAAASARHKRGDRAAAIDAYREILAYDPRLFDAHRLLGAALYQEDRAAEAVPALEAALDLRTDSDEVWVLHGTCLAQLGQERAALSSIERASALRPDKPDVWTNLGLRQQALGRFREALTSYDRAIALAPERPAYRFNRGLLRLSMGDFTGGWSDWEARLAMPELAPELIEGRPQWDGQASLKGKTLLLVCEQGQGDTIQFSRFAPLLAARGATVILGVPPSLRRLMLTLGGGVTVVSDNDPLPPIDYQFPLLSLAGRAGITSETVPWSGPYLKASEERRAHWASALADTSRRRDETRPRRYGLAFSGNAEHRNDRARSIALERLAPLIQASPPGCEWHLLQNDLRARDQAQLRDLGIVDHRAALVDFAETAALASCMDAVVSVDTSVAHLAGALGLPLFLLLPFNPDWRWMLERTDTPWYPRARLLRQTAPDDWSHPLQLLQELLS
jgi:tetratricopeptide (TPR) repeat protein